MKFRGTFAILAATLVVVATAAHANAAKLVYTQALTHTDNALIPTGETVYTLAVQTTAADGTGALGISFSMTGSGGAPIQVGAGGVQTYQKTQDNYDIAVNNGVDTATPPNFTSVNLVRATDTFFYASPTGQLTSDNEVNDPTFTGIATVVTGDAKLGAPGLSPNPFSLLWNPSQTIVMTNTSGGTSSFSGLWGAPTAAAGSPLIAESSVGAGIYPFAQIAVNAAGTVTLTDGITNTTSFGISTPGGQYYNYLGGIIPQGVNTAPSGAVLTGNPLAYLTNPLAIGPATAVPEPSTFVLAGLAIVGVLAARRRK